MEPSSLKSAPARFLLVPIRLVAGYSLDWESTVSESIVWKSGSVEAPEQPILDLTSHSGVYSLGVYSLRV